jgi:hypothetical protein
MKVFDNYEISPCMRNEEPRSPGKFYFEVCEPSEADVWTLYGHINGEGVQAIGDFDSRERAEEVYSFITGQPFPGSNESSNWLRVMHAAPRMLDALKALRDDVVSYGLHHPEVQAQFMPDETLEAVEQAIADATRRPA